MTMAYMLHCSNSSFPGPSQLHDDFQPKFTLNTCSVLTSISPSIFRTSVSIWLRPFLQSVYTGRFLFLLLSTLNGRVGVVRGGAGTPVSTNSLCNKSTIQRITYVPVGGLHPLGVSEGSGFDSRACAVLQRCSLLIDAHHNNLYQYRVYRGNFQRSSIDKEQKITSNCTKRLQTANRSMTYRLRAPSGWNWNVIIRNQNQLVKHHT